MAVDHLIPMKFHRLNQFFILPVSLVSSVTYIIMVMKGIGLFIENKNVSVLFMYVSLYAVSAVLNIVTEVGFVRNRGYSYYSFLTMQGFNVANLFFSYSYIFDIKSITHILNNFMTELPGVTGTYNSLPITDLAYRCRVSMGFGIIISIAITVLMIFYYMKRKCVFEFKDTAQMKMQKRNSAMWVNKERYTPGHGVKLSRKEEASLAGRRLNNLNGSEKNDKPPESETFDGIK